MAQWPSETPTRPSRPQANAQLFTPVTPLIPHVFNLVDTVSAPPPRRQLPTFSQSSFSFVQTPASSKPKRKNKENLDPTPSKKHKEGSKRLFTEFAAPSSTTLKPTADFSVYDKLRIFHGFLSTELGWTLGELFYYATMTTKQLRESGAEPIDIELEHSHRFKPATKLQRSSSLQHFFNGRGTYTPGIILNQWWKSPYGKTDRDSPDMYCVSKSFKDIRPIRPCISSFAAQIIAARLSREADKAVNTSSGLHIAITRKSRAVKTIEWPDFSADTIPTTGRIQAQHQQLSRQLLARIADTATPATTYTSGERQKRPLNPIITNALNILNFSRTASANLGPLAHGLLYLAMGAPFDLFRLRSRLGEMPSYTTVVRALGTLADHEASVTLYHGRDRDTLGFIYLDNIQNYLIQRDPAIGRDNKLIIGIAATYYECVVEERVRQAFCIEQKARSVAEGKRRHLTVNKLLGLIDSAHIERVCVLQWIRALVHAVPELEHLKPDISNQYRTKAAKQRLPVAVTKCHPLASSSRNETITAELRIAILDFMEQTGQTRDDFKKLLFVFGGDGLTFEKLKQLRLFLQFEPDTFDAMRNMHPLLAWWHTEWTNLSRLTETHWGPLNGRDPSSLGHSAQKIGHKKPPNLKKVDFYISRDLVSDVLDARLLDIWRLHLCPSADIFEHFIELKKDSKLPSFEMLEIDAIKLYHAYTSLRAQSKAAMGRSTTPSIIPSGTLWTDGSSEGDQVLVRSISFMRDAMFAREFSLATAEGDVGRIWELIKILVFTFAGSSHSKYTTYLLEMITDIEFESTADLKEGLLQMTLVNLTGREGHWNAGDFIQEYFNCLLEAIVQRKGVDYGDAFIRKNWARNLHNIARLKIFMLDGVGLKGRSRKHTGAKRVAARKILLAVYKDEELHTFRTGRSYDSEEYIDDFDKGVTALQAGKLTRWVNKTTRMQNVTTSPTDTEILTDDELNSDPESDDNESDDDEEQSLPRNIRFSAVVDGELVVEPEDAVEKSVTAIVTEEDSDESEVELEDVIDEDHESDADNDEEDAL